MASVMDTNELASLRPKNLLILSVILSASVRSTCVSLKWYYP